MSVLAIGLNHRTAPLGLLERMTVEKSNLPKALGDLIGREHLSEAVVLSTCNRIEVYVFAETFHGAFQNLRDFLSETSHIAPEHFSDYLYTYYEADAVSHLFTVACGLDSVVRGEHEIQGQVRDAWDKAQQEGTCGTTLNAVFRHAVEVGKRARSEVGISRHITSLSHAAVVLAAQRLDGLSGRRLMVAGAGDMGEGMTGRLAGCGAADIVVANRTPERAKELANRVGGRAVSLTEMSTELVEADVLLTSTGASSLMLEHDEVAEIMVARRHRPLLIVDVAVPRDVDPAAGGLDGVTLLDMDDLQAFADLGVREHRVELDRVREIIDYELNRYVSYSSAREVAPLVAAFRTQAESVCQQELDRHTARLSPAERAAVESVARGMVGKLLHQPTVRLKDAAGSPRGDRLAEALRDLFDL